MKTMAARDGEIDREYLGPTLRGCHCYPAELYLRSTRRCAFWPAAATARAKSTGPGR